jgi:2-oxoglutarate ferredoxin oxidoreductase subunit gamma
MLLAGLILSEAAGIYDGRYVTQTRSYGPEARGGASKSEVVISTEEIDYPKVTRPDLLLAMTQEAFDKYCGDLKDDGILIVDSFFVHQLSGREAISLPITSLAREKLGRELFANTISLGIIVALTDAVSEEGIRKAVLARAPKGTEEKNSRALEIGFEVANDYRRKGQQSVPKG